jgi:hypothetical protein
MDGNFAQSVPPRKMMDDLRNTFENKTGSSECHAANWQMMTSVLKI